MATTTTPLAANNAATTTTTTVAATTATTTATTVVWLVLGENAECDDGGYIEPPPGRKAPKNLTQCKQSCEKNNDCKSITFFSESGYCNPNPKTQQPLNPKA